MNRLKTILAAWNCLLAGGRCEMRSPVEGDRCRLPKDHVGSHVFWLCRWFRGPDKWTFK